MARVVREYSEYDNYYQEYYVVNNKIEGDRIAYMNNTPIDICNWVSDKKNGISKSYHTTSPNIKHIFYYINDKIEGVYKIHFPNGNISGISNYKNNKLQGEYIQYTQNGTIKQSKTYDNGILHGKCIDYYSNGNISNIYNFDNADLHGEYITYDYNNANVIKTIKYYDRTRLLKSVNIT